VKPEGFVELSKHTNWFACTSCVSGEKGRYTESDICILQGFTSIAAGHRKREQQH
jgi:hypothetical protein